LEGEAGFLKVFCTEWDVADLTRGLGDEFVTMNLCLKRFPVHMTAHTGVQAVLELKAAHGFTGGDVDRVVVAGNQRMATINNIPDPADMMMAQYSIPFCIALSLFRDPRDPVSFDGSALTDPDIRAMCGRVSVVVAEPPTKVAGASVVTILLKDGKSVTKEVAEFSGTPARPLDHAELKDKFMTLTRARYGAAASGLFDRLDRIEDETELGWVGA
jgi:2-methylcitrate dehydratase PrpD